MPLRKTFQMGRLIWVLSCTAVLGAPGCTLLFQGTTDRVAVDSDPSGVPVSFGGQETRTPGTVTLSRRHDFAILRVNAPGYEPYCELVKSHGNPLLTTLDSIPAAIPLLIDVIAGATANYPETVTVKLTPARPGAEFMPLPSDKEVLHAWTEQNRNLCIPREYQSLTPQEQLSPTTAQAAVRRESLVVTSGSVSQPYRILGNVHIDTTDKSTFGHALGNWATGTGLIGIAIRGGLTDKEEPEVMRDALKARAIEMYGDKVDALINVNERHERGSGDIYIEGLAVQFTNASPSSPAADRTTAERLHELERLYDSGAITKGEYGHKRAAILDEL